MFHLICSDRDCEGLPHRRVEVREGQVGARDCFNHREGDDRQDDGEGFSISPHPCSLEDAY